MHARVVQVFLHGDRRRREGRIGRGLVARLPREDVVVVVAWTVRAFGLAGEIFANHRRVGLQRRIRVDDRLQLLVLDVDGFDRVGRDVAVVCDHDRDFLHLEVHLAVGQHRGDVAGQRRHPVELQRLQVFRGQHGVHAGNRQRCLLVDPLDARMGQRRPHDVHVQHAGHLDVVDVVSLALDEAGVLLAQAALAHALQRGESFRGVHAASCWCCSACSLSAAHWIALTMFW